MTSLETVRVQTRDEEPLEGLHLAYRTAMFTSQVGANQWSQESGYVIYLRDGGALIAMTEGLGTSRDAQEEADEISLDTSRDWPWLGTLCTLARARRVDALADAFLRNLRAMTRWRDGEDPDVETPSVRYLSREEQEWDDVTREEARNAKRGLAKYVPADLQARMPLRDATGEHIDRLRARAAGLRAAVIRDMPDPRTTPRPHRWIADYTPAEAKEVRALSLTDPLDPWLADLPHWLLRCWAELPEAERQALGTDYRDALLMWAVEWRLPKSCIARASGVARTTIDRVIRKGARPR
ncbi:hypothetical protein [Streptomyces sp. NPDC088731]|uniref:hypothetical protein n=1 Tax=Streptomyces sp. NPDC088731 TaxID=3365878 RepID=UPI0037FB89B4